MSNTKYEEGGLSSEQEFLSGLTRHKLNESPTTSGMPLCYKDGEVYTDDSDSHTLIFGNTGTKNEKFLYSKCIYDRHGRRIHGYF